ncbi:UNVERIFIED_CONTAM: hypothetical protein K2H54_046731 [Gekko kuhli]
MIVDTGSITLNSSSNYLLFVLPLPGLQMKFKEATFFSQKKKKDKEIVFRKVYCICFPTPPNMEALTELKRCSIHITFKMRQIHYPPPPASLPTHGFDSVERINSGA